MRKNNLYIKTKKGIKCLLCPHECDLAEGQSGICLNRKNSKGKMISLAYGHPCAINLDPIEKKPLFHFLPTSSTLSIGTEGCNLNCKNCQNYEISQHAPSQAGYSNHTPQQIINKTKIQQSKIISYTYNEPITYYEYMYDIAVLAHQSNIKNVIVSNGYINENPLKELLPFLDGANIDLKCFNDITYKKLTGASLYPVLKTLEILRDSNVWLEITNLIIPRWSDDFDMIKEMCTWLVNNGFSKTPIHFNRFFPTYKLSNTPHTAEIVLMKARDIALSMGMEYVYVGNFLGRTVENTYCPKCNNLLVERIGYNVTTHNFKNGTCPNCGTRIPGVWSI